MLSAVKLACQAVSGKQNPLDLDLEEACKAAAMREVGEVTLEVGDLSGARPFITDLGVDPKSSEAEHVPESCQNAIETRAVASPLMFEVAVPNGSRPGETVKANGPGGPIVLQLPPDAKPGGSLRYAMKPKPRYLVEVPPKAGPGWTIRFQANGGDEVMVPVPPGKNPGDTFEVTPPALMVEVPERAQPGDYVKFNHIVDITGNTRGGMTECFRAIVPEGVMPKQFFVAHIPPPPLQQMRQQAQAN